MTTTDTNLQNLIINTLNQTQFEGATKSENELYLVTDAEINVSDISDLTATATELNYCDGVTSNIQTQLDGKQASGDYISYTNNTVTVAGRSKTVSKTTPDCLFVNNGLIMGGTAASAGLVTRGICGSGVPNSTTGACDKDQLYLNCDGDNTWNPARGVVINGIEIGTNLGQSMYSHCAVRGDIVKAWVEANVYNGVDSTSTTQPLSANQGKVLQDQITHLKSIGRFLSLWNASTGLAQTNPTTSPYTYQTGDYFIVGTVAAEGSTNYKPDGSSYTIGTASTVVESNTVKVGYIYYYDNSSWNLVAVESSTVTDVQVNGTSVTTDGVGNVPLGSDSTFGAVKVDNSSITATNGVVSVNQNQTIRLVYTDGTEASLSLFGVLS